MPLSIDARSRLLFVGDSITDCQRKTDPETLGFGYVRLIRDYLRAKVPETAPHVLNAGVSGNTIEDLAARWDTDVLGLRPDVLSILIGVNDVWHRVERVGSGGVPIEQFRQTYRKLLQTMLDLRPNPRIVLCEPTVISAPAHPRGNVELADYVAAVHELGSQFRVQGIVPLHTAFRGAEKFRPDVDWTVDGVHPTSSGHMLIARTWLQTTGLL